VATRRRTFFSFHYKPDNWRAAQVRNMGVVEGNAPVSDNDWETIQRGGDAAIKRWINGQSTKGDNPFSGFTVGTRKLSGIVQAYSPPYTGSRNVYSYIEQNIAEWVEEAIQIRKSYL